MKFLLTLPAWGLFTLLFVLPLMVQFLPLSVDSGMISALVFLVAYFCWLYAVGTNLYPRLPTAVKMSRTRFLIFWTTAVVMVGSLMLTAVTMGATSSKSNNSGFGIFMLLFLLMLLYFFSAFYCMYFCAKALKAVESQRPLTIGDYLGEIFLFWFFPLGVWALQPRISKVFASEETA